MSTTVEAARTDLLTRVRMTGVVAFSVTNIYGIISKCEQLVNLLLHRVVDTETLTTTLGIRIYDMRDDLPSAMRVISVTESDRTLRYLGSWKNFAEYSRTWRSDYSTRFEAWGRMGATHLIVWPGKVGASSVEVTFVKAIAAMTANDHTFELPDEDVDLVIDLAEIFLLVALHRYTELNLRITSFAERVKRYV